VTRRARHARAAALLALGLALAGAPSCRNRTGTAGGEGDPVLQLVRSGQYDEAIARLAERADPESLYLLGLAWAGKAKSAPLPTPVPGGAAGAILWKPEELRAAEFLQRSLSARPDHAGAHVALAELIAPHALERVQAARGASGPAAAAAPGSGEPDSRLEAVLGHFAEALRIDTAGTAAAESLVQFATQAGRLAEADAGYQELVRRRREDPELLVRYGDFLATARGDSAAALAQYAQALMWRPGDAATREKVALIHLRAAAEHLDRHEYASAEARLADARRAAAPPTSAAATRLREIEQALRDIRGR
jgi:hypothetical protein